MLTPLHPHPHTHLQEALALLSRERAQIAAAASAEVASRVEAAAADQAIASGAAAEEALQRLQSLSTRVGALTELLQGRNDYELAAGRAARLTLSVAALADALQRRASATQEVAAVRAAAGEDCVIIQRALALLPPSAHSEAGTPRVIELQVAFRAVSEAGRRAPPPGSGLLGRALSLAGATLVLPAQKGAAEAGALVSDGAARVGAAVRGGSLAVKSAVAEENAPHPALAPVFRAAGGLWEALERGVAAAAGSALGAVEGAWGAASSAVRGAVATSPPPSAAAPASGSESSPSPAAAVIPAELAATAQAKLAAGRAVFDVTEVRLRAAATLFDAAEAAVRKGDLGGAVELLQELQDQEGQGGTRAWVTAAKQRLAADRAVRLVRARADLEVAALY